MKPNYSLLTGAFLLASSLSFSFSGCNLDTNTLDARVKTSKHITPPQKAHIDSVLQLEAVKAASHKKFVLDSLRFKQVVSYLYNKDTAGKWPAFKQRAEGAILPFDRIIAFYGNLSSKKMGIFGEIPKKQMFAKLKFEVKKWSFDSATIHSIPAFDYIAVSAQGSPGKDGKYRLRMPFHQVDTVVSWTNQIGGIMFIDIQVGQSTLQAELPRFEKYFALPNVHLSIDPEFSMKTHRKPGSVIGTFDAADINYAQDFLARIVKANNLPPKILVIHRFTKKMLTNYKNIEHKPQVQIVMHMDGWGNPPKKIGTYQYIVKPEPVEYTGFKIFYKNDVKKVGMKQEMQPQAVLALSPRPVYIQYQ